MKILAIVGVLLLRAALVASQNQLTDARIDYYLQVGNKMVCFNTFGDLILTDGSVEKTRKLKFKIDSYSFYKVVGNNMFFSSIDSENNIYALYKIDVERGEVKKVGSAIPENPKTYLTAPIVFKNQLFFLMGNDYPEIWTSDGQSISKVNLSIGIDITTWKIASITPFSQKLLILLSNGTRQQLWISDETLASATKIKESVGQNFTRLSFGNLDWRDRFLNSQTERKDENNILGSELFFSAYDSIHGQELWKTDGTAGGTQIVKDLTPGFTSYGSQSFINNSNPYNIFSCGQYVFFGIEGGELWRTDGTNAGTILLKKSDTGFSSFRKINEKLFFLSTDVLTGTEPWTSGGQPENTKIVQDIWPGPASSTTVLHPATDRVLFSANNGSTNEIWQIDQSGTSMRINPLLPKKFSASWQSRIVELPNNILYTQRDSVGNELLFSLDKGNIQFSEVSQATRLPANYWFQTIGGSGYYNSSQAIFNYDMATTEQNDVFVAGVCGGCKMIKFFDNNYVKPLNPAYSNAFLSKFNSKGVLQWTKDLQSTESYYRKHASITTDLDGAVYYATSFYPGNGYYSGSNFFEVTSAETDINAYLVKFNESGNQQWISSGRAPQGIQISNVKSDGSGNIFMTGLYFGFRFSWSGVSMSAAESPTYFIQKFDQFGNAIWGKNISTGWTSYGNVSDMEIDANRKLVYALISKGGRNVSSSCEYEKWQAQLLAFDYNGNQIWKREFESSDLMMANSLAVGPNGDLLLVGYFRGKLTWDSKTLQTDKSGGCNLSSSFFFRISKNGEMLSLQTDNPRDIEPFEVQFLSNGNYLVSGIERSKETKPYVGFGSPYPSGKRQMFIRQYDYGGNILYERKFNKFEYDFDDSNPIVRVDRNNDLIFSERFKGKFDSIRYSVPNESYGQNLALMKIKLTSSNSKIIESNLLEGIQIFPNPTNQRAYLKIWRDQFGLQDFSVEIFDITGKTVYSKISLPVDDVFAIETSQFLNGLYLIKISNGQFTTTKRMVVSH